MAPLAAVGLLELELPLLRPSRKRLRWAAEAGFTRGVFVDVTEAPRDVQRRAYFVSATERTFVPHPPVAAVVACAFGDIENDRLRRPTQLIHERSIVLANAREKRSDGVDEKKRNVERVKGGVGARAVLCVVHTPSRRRFRDDTRREPRPSSSIARGLCYPNVSARNVRP